MLFARCFGQHWSFSDLYKKINFLNCISTVRYARTKVIGST
jgi:hypothetical protein